MKLEPMWFAFCCGHVHFADWHPEPRRSFWWPVRWMNLIIFWWWLFCGQQKVDKLHNRGKRNELPSFLCAEKSSTSEDAHSNASLGTPAPFPQLLYLDVSSNQVLCERNSSSLSRCWKDYRTDWTGWFHSLNDFLSTVIWYTRAAGGLTTGTKNWRLDRHVPVAGVLEDCSWKFGFRWMMKKTWWL